MPIILTCSCYFLTTDYSQTGRLYKPEGPLRSPTVLAMMDVIGMFFKQNDVLRDRTAAGTLILSIAKILLNELQRLSHINCYLMVTSLY